MAHLPPGGTVHGPRIRVLVVMPCHVTIAVGCISPADILQFSVVAVVIIVPRPVFPPAAEIDPVHEQKRRITITAHDPTDVVQSIRHIEMRNNQLVVRLKEPRLPEIEIRGMVMGPTAAEIREIAVRRTAQQVGCIVSVGDRAAQILGDKSGRRAVPFVPGNRAAVLGRAPGTKLIGDASSRRIRQSSVPIIGVKK